MQGESGEVNYPDAISSIGLWPCIAAGLYDRNLRCAYMIHEANALVDGDLPKFIENVLGTSNITDLIIWVTGGGVLDKETKEDKAYTMENRNYVEDVIRDTFTNEQVNFCWQENNVLIEEIAIYTETGKCEIIPRTDS